MNGRRTRLPAAFVGLVVVASAFLSAAPAAAQDEPPTSEPPAATVGEPDVSSSTTLPAADAAAHCDEIVSDDGSHLAGPELGPAVFSMAAAGFDLHVRVVTDLPDSSQVSTLESVCGWRDGAERRPRSALLFVTAGVDEAALWFGSELRATVGARFAAIRQDVLDQPYGQSGGSRAATLLARIERLATAAPNSDPLGCSQLVTDSGAQLGSGFTEVEEAAFSLQAAGTDVRARVEPALDGGSIDDRLAQLDRTCSGWQLDGDRAPHLVVVAVSPISRRTGIWYGAEESDGLADEWSGIQDRDMNPRFKDGDFAGGMAAGLRAIEELRRPGRSIDPNDYYQSAPYFDGDGAPSSGYRDTTSSDSNGGEVVFWLFVSVLLIGGTMAFSYFSWRSKYDSGETDLSFSEYNRQNGRRGGGRYWGGGGGFGGFGGGGHSSGGGFSGGGGGGGHSSGGGGGHHSGGGSSSW